MRRFGPTARASTRSAVLPRQAPIGGQNKLVEADETYIGGKAGKVYELLKGAQGKQLMYHQPGEAANG
jgi:hypothetical protein